MTFGYILILKVRAQGRWFLAILCLNYIHICEPTCLLPKKKRKIIDYDLELFIKNKQTKDTNHLLLFSVGINLSKQDFFILCSKLKFLLSTQLVIGLMFALVCKLEDRLGIIDQVLLEHLNGE